MNKINPYRLTILDIIYKFNDKGKTTCQIAYLNPITGNKSKAIGVSKLKPGEKFVDYIGKRIAESRAKREMYINYADFLEAILSDCHYKHVKLADKELEHIRKMIDDLR